MLQRSEIGKYVSVSNKDSYYLNDSTVMVTPNNDRYRVVSIEKAGKCKIYTYLWINSPENIISVFGAVKCQFKSLQSCENIMNWIESVKNAFELEIKNISK